MSNGKIILDDGAVEVLKEVTEATTVVANPTLEGTEPDLTGLEVDGTKYAVPQGGGSTVVANPELSGDEPDLTGLEVEGNKYKVPQGGGSELGDAITIDSTNFEAYDTYFGTSIGGGLYRVGIIFKNKTTNEKYCIVCTTDTDPSDLIWSDPDIFNICMRLVRGGDLVLKEGGAYFTKMGVVCQYTDSSSTSTVIQMLK